MKIIFPLSLAAAAVFCFSGGLAAGEGEIKASIVKSRPLVEGRSTPGIVRLDRSGGLPVMAGELEKPLRLLIADPALSDFHVEHPNPMNAAGEYIFTMTPRTPCGYRVWAEVDTAAAAPQYAVTDIDGAEKCSDRQIDRTVSTTHQNDNYRFLLEFGPEGLKAGQTTTLKLTVRDRKGRYITELEPVGDGFAHLVGIYDDYRTITTAQPLNEAPTSGTDVAGPTLKFSFTPAHDGFIRLLAHVKIAGIIHSMLFGVEVGSRAVDLEAWVPPENNTFADIPAEQQPAPSTAKPSDEEIEWIMQQETKALAAERATKNKSSLEGLYQGADTGDGSLYDDPEARLLKNAPEIPELDLSDQELPPDYSDEPLQ